MILKLFKSTSKVSHKSLKSQKLVCVLWTSEPVIKYLGMPQGFLLGPLLSIIYINYIIRVIKECKIRLFADDTLIYNHR